ncbi:MAG: hypothetical protein ACYCZE_00850 [Thiobacillus sp.]
MDWQTAHVTMIQGIGTDTRTVIAGSARKKQDGSKQSLANTSSSSLSDLNFRQKQGPTFMTLS